MSESVSAITGSTKITGIFGDPVTHSLSPLMHNAAYRALAMDRVYVPFHVGAERLPEAIRGLQALGIAGVNLTVPHKERAVRMMSHLSDEARSLGAVNCIVNRAGELHGDNTDARGLEADLRDNKLSLVGKTALIIGAGGAAASAVLACIRMEAAQIIVANRTPARASRLVRRFTHYLAAQGHEHPRKVLSGCGLDALSDTRVIGQAAIIINATPMGLKTERFADLAFGVSASDCAFYDLIYARADTPFLAPARRLGRRVFDGAGMLVNQAVLAFELFNGTAPPAGVMRDALMRALGR